MKKNKNVPGIRFNKFTEKWNENIIDRIVSVVQRPITMEDDKEYQLLTVKRRNGGVTSRGYFKGRSILVKNYFEVRACDYVISKRQVVHGANGLVPESLDKSIVSNEYLVIGSNESISTNFLALISKRHAMYKLFFLSSYGVDIEKLVFDVEDWKKRTIIIPSLSEQNNIVEFFDTLDNQIALYSQKLDKLKNIKKACLEKMFPKKGATIPEIRLKGFCGEWEEKVLGKIGNTFTGLSGKTKEDFGRGDAEYITYLNVFSHPIANRFGTERVDIDNKQNKVQYGDIFFTTSSEVPEEVGMSSIWLSQEKNIYLNSFCFGYRLNEDVDPYYITYLLRSPSIRKKISFLAQGISRYNISKNRVMEIEVLFPNCEEQKQIGLFFKKNEDLIDMNQTQLSKLKNIKKACLEKMFVNKEDAL